MGVFDPAVRWALDKFERRMAWRSSPAYRPVTRVQALLRAHGVQLPQVLRFVPSDWGWSLNQVSNDQGLQESLGVRELSWFAGWLGVELAWLEGASERMYSPIWFYKDVYSVPEILAGRGMAVEGLEVIAFTDSKQPLDRSARLGQNLAITFSVPVGRIGEQEIRRYLICNDAWAWDHAPCRRDLKILARTAFRLHHLNVPIVPVPRKTLKNLLEGKAFPSPLVPFSIGGLDCLEDYALGETESVIARETDELEVLLPKGGWTTNRLYPPADAA